MKSLILSLTLLAAFNVNAATVTINETTNPTLDTTFLDAGNATHLDTTTNLEWLDFGSLVEGEITFGYSIENALATYGSQGFRLATYDEVYGLFDMFFPTFDGGTSGIMTIDEGDGTDPLLTSRNSWLFGFGTDAEVLQDGTVISDSGFLYSTGMYIDENGDVQMLGFRINAEETITTTFFGPEFSVSGLDITTGYSNLGVFMVRDYTVVPVPAAVWLFASGLIGLAAVARRKVK